MPWRYHRIWIVALLLISGLVLAWLIAQTPVPKPVSDTATTTPEVVAGQAIYTSGEHGFAIVYPQSARIENLPGPWRANAPLESKAGTITSFYTYEVYDEVSPIRAFTAVYIGASSEAVDMPTCEAVTPDRGETALADESFGGAIWKVFSFGASDMRQSVQGKSYRTMRNGICYAIETYRSLSHYRKAEGVTVDEARLDAEYAKLDAIVKSFSFAR